VTVSVLVPYRADGGARDRAWAWIRRWWNAEHPGWQLVEGRCDDGPWRKAVAVDDALARADGDVLVVADADVFVAGAADAVAAVRAGSAGWAVPHHRVHRLSEPATAAVLAGEPWPRAARAGYARPPYKGVAGGGIAVLPRSTYERVPIDARFEAWGSEDLAWGAALDTVAGRHLRGSAPLVHLWHPPAPRLNAHVGSAASHALLVRWQYAAKAGPAAVDGLVAEARAAVAAR